MGREFELKYQADAGKIATIQEKFGEFLPITMETVYYDTPGGALRQRRWMLRRRLENGRPICTVKTPLPDGSRGEWETECADITQAVSKLCKLGAPEELSRVAQSGLHEICAARFLRLSATLEHAGCTLELALDRGCFLGGGRQVPFAEVEVELKDGSELAAVAFAEGLAKEFSLTPEAKSKAQRAMALAD